MSWYRFWWFSLKRLEFYLRVPLGFWKGDYHHLEKLASSKGWHWHYKLICMDFPAHRWTKLGYKNKTDQHIRLQWQTKHIPLKSVVWQDDEYSYV